MQLDIGLGATDGNIVVDYTSEGITATTQGVGPRYGIEVKKAGDEITIRGQKETEAIGGETIPAPVDATTSKLKDPKPTQKDEITPRSTTTTEESVKFKIDRYDNTILSTTVTKTEGEAKYNVGLVDLSNDKENDINYKSSKETSLDYGVGYINVLLHYKSTIETSDEKATVWANIDSEDELTIATKITGITGQVRLKFTADDQTFYSKDTFNVKDGDAIYCKINDTNKKWYTNEWKVTILDVNNGPVTSGEVEYYTINDKDSLSSLSEAVKEGAHTKKADDTPRIFYLIENLNMDGISMDPIAPSCEEGKLWFDGYFGSGIYDENEVKQAYIDEESGKKIGFKTISNLKIKVSENKDYAFGLFGWVGKPAKIENLIIDNVNVDLNGRSR